MVARLRSELTSPSERVRARAARAGMGLAPLRLQLANPRLQAITGGTAVFAIALAWLAAFLV